MIIIINVRPVHKYNENLKKLIKPLYCNIVAHFIVVDSNPEDRCSV